MNKELEETIRILEETIRILEEAIRILEDENQVIYDSTTGKVDERWRTAYKTIIQVAKNSIPKEVIEKKIKEVKQMRDTTTF